MSDPESKRNEIHLHKFASGETQAASPNDMGQTEFIRQSAAETVAEAGDIAAQEATEFGLPPEEMLGVIAYCYVKGVFCSGDIAELLKNDPSLRAKFGRNLPDGSAVRRFRRRYAAEIEDVLEDVFRTFPKTGSSTEKQTEFVQREAAELLHDAVRIDNSRSHFT